MEMNRSRGDVPTVAMLVVALAYAAVFSAAALVLWRVGRFQYIVLFPGCFLVTLALATGLRAWGAKSRHLAYEAGSKLSWGFVGVSILAESGTALWAMRWAGFAMLFIFVMLGRRNSCNVADQPSDGPSAV